MILVDYGTAMNPATTGAAVSYGLLTRAYESEPFRNAMLRMANTPRGSTAFEKAMQQAQKAINSTAQGLSLMRCQNSFANTVNAKPNM